MKQYGGEVISAQNTVNIENDNIGNTNLENTVNIENDNIDNTNLQNTVNIENDNVDNTNLQNTVNIENDNIEAINYLYLYSRGGYSSNNKKMRQKGSSCSCNNNGVSASMKGGDSKNMRGGCLECPSGKKKVLSYLNIICKNVSNIRKEYDKSCNVKNHKGGNISDAFFDLSYLDLSTKQKFEYQFVEGNKSLLI